MAAAAVLQRRAEDRRGGGQAGAKALPASGAADDLVTVAAAWMEMLRVRRYAAATPKPP